MEEIPNGLHYRVVGIRSDGTRDARYSNLSLRTAEQVKNAMCYSEFFVNVVIENDNLAENPATESEAVVAPVVKRDSTPESSLPNTPVDAAIGRELVG